jgi:hypothetical protein
MNAPLSVRQVWRGLAKQGDTLTFDTLLLPHAVKYQRPEANWVADGVKCLSADPQQTAVSFDVPATGEHVLLVASNHGAFTGENVTTDATQALVVWKKDQVVNWWVRGATTLKVGDKVLVQTTERGNKEG